jgi:DNA-binding HxlR family transcriptional regulator
VAPSKTPQGSPAGRSLLLPLIHGRVRLLILSGLLRVTRPLSFTELRKELKLTDGTLSVHLSKLEEGGLISIRKTFEGKRPLTLVSVTAKGKRLFQQYVADLRTVIPDLD